MRSGAVFAGQAGGGSRRNDRLWHRAGTGHQGGGVATRAVAALAEWARDDARLDTLLAETAPTNTASQIVVERAGFVRFGTRVDDEDGELFCWRLDVSGGAG